ncbi:ATP-binding cassette domain-containing protein, partial [Campylobacter concisus]
MIKIKNLTKSFGDAKILKGINLEIKQNEFCVLLGGSGSGKTTLLNILSGTSELSSGEISMQNKIYTKKISLDKSRQIITQTYSLMPWLSAKDNIKFALKCSGIKDK